MICPACKTNNTNNPHLEHCVQCGMDIQVHRLLQKITEKIPMNDERSKTQASLPNKTSLLLMFSQIMPSTLLLICAIFGIFVGMRFLSVIDKTQSHRLSIASKWSETGFEQLQQMNHTIQQELKLILDQRRENLALQLRLQELTQSTSLAQNTKESSLPSVTQGLTQ